MIGKVMEFGMNVGTEQFRGLSQTSPRTIRDAEENQHGAIVASTALEQIMRLSIELGYVNRGNHQRGWTSLYWRWTL